MLRLFYAHFFLGHEEVFPLKPQTAPSNLFCTKRIHATAPEVYIDTPVVYMSNLPKGVVASGEGDSPNAVLAPSYPVIELWHDSSRIVDVWYKYRALL